MKFNEYVEKCKILGWTWSYKFNHSMNDDDHKQFREDCKNFEVNPLDVFEYIEDYELY